MPEWETAAEELTARGFITQRFLSKEITRRRLPLRPESPVVGQIPSVIEALRQLGITPPAPLDYPESLYSYLKRRLWQNTVGAVTQDIWDDAHPIFIKPAESQKRFPGFVLDGPDTLWQLEGAGRRHRVWCATPIRFLSEWRFFVISGSSVGYRCYKGDVTLFPEEALVEEMISVYASNGAPAGYGIDIGVLESGETALVEVNDGFGLGAYGLPPIQYSNLLLARWRELTGV